MSNLGDWVGVVGSTFGVIVLLISAFIFVSGSYNKARIQALREDNQDLRDRVNDLDSELERTKAREDKLEAQVQHLVTENQLLADMITQRANVEALSDMLDHHHSEAMKAWDKIAKAIEVLRDQDQA